jgi:hypothetical protein
MAIKLSEKFGRKEERERQITHLLPRLVIMQQSHPLQTQRSQPMEDVLALCGYSSDRRTDERGGRGLRGRSRGGRAEVGEEDKASEGKRTDEVELGVYLCDVENRNKAGFVSG